MTPLRVKMVEKTDKARIFTFPSPQLSTALGAEFWIYGFAKIFITGRASPIEKGKYQDRND
jgi:hypothetical protein